MNIDQIKALAQILSEHGLTSLEVSEGGVEVHLKREIPMEPVQTQPAAVSAAVPPPEPGMEPDAYSVDFNRLIEVKSPMVGVLYSAASPDSEPFVSIGSQVKKGDVLCIIETMKLMNEITAEQDGEIVDICVRNGDIAEFGQVLFKMF